jgi:hypothetical protein
MIQNAELEDNVKDEDGRSLSAIFFPGTFGGHFFPNQINPFFFNFPRQPAFPNTNAFFFGTTQFPVPFFNGFNHFPFLFGFGGP